MRCILVVFTFFLFSIYAPGQNAKIVVIDPGHGGHDSGAIGINGIREKDIVLRIALETEVLNTLSKESHLQVYLTRYTDTFISLKDRSIIPKGLKANLFISLHSNYSKNPDARGIEMYVNEQKNSFMTESLVFATSLENEFMSSIGFESRGVKYANFQVIKDVSRICKAVLFEIGFLSNSDEAYYLDKNIETIASAIVKTINENLGL